MTRATKKAAAVPATEIAAAAAAAAALGGAPGAHDVEVFEDAEEAAEGDADLVDPDAMAEGEEAAEGEGLKEEDDEEGDDDRRKTLAKDVVAIAAPALKPAPKSKTDDDEDEGPARLFIGGIGATSKEAFRAHWEAFGPVHPPIHTIHSPRS
jgi:hypothetical protein